MTYQFFRDKSKRKLVSRPFIDPSTKEVKPQTKIEYAALDSRNPEQGEKLLDVTKTLALQIEANIANSHCLQGITRHGTGPSTSYDLKPGDLRTLIILSPDESFVKYLSAKAENLHKTGTIINISSMEFKLEDTKKLHILIPRSSFALITGTPIIIRIHKEKYKVFGLKLDIQCTGEAIIQSYYSYNR